MSTVKQSVKKNFLYQICYQVLTMLLPFITAPYISRILGAENVGIYSYTYTIASYFVQFAALGINNHGSRAIAQVRENQDELNKTFSDIFADHLLVSLLTFFAYIIYVACFCKFPEVAIAQGMIVLGTVLDINWFFFGLEKFKLTVTRNIVVKVATVVCIFIFVNDRSDLLIYTIIMAAGTMISQSVVWLFLRKEVSFIKPDFIQMKKHFKDLFVMFVAVMAVSLYRTIDKVMLGMMADMTQVGCYENADKLIMYPVSIITALGTIMLPRMSNLYKNGDEKVAGETLVFSVEFAVILSLAMCFGLNSVSEDFCVMFYGPEFVLSGSILSIISVTIPFMAINNVLRTQYIIPTNQDRIYVIAVLMGAIANFVFNYTFIPMFGAYGATIGTILADLIVFLYQLFSLRKQLPIKDFLLQGVYPFISGICMCVIVKSFAFFIGGGVVAVTFQILVGVVSYCVLMCPYFLFSKKSKVSKYIRFVFKKKLEKVKN